MGKTRRKKKTIALLREKPLEVKIDTNAVIVLLQKKPQTQQEWLKASACVPKRMARQIFIDIDSEQCLPCEEMPKDWPYKMRCVANHQLFRSYYSAQTDNAVKRHECFPDVSLAETYFGVLKLVCFAVLNASMEFD